MIKGVFPNIGWGVNDFETDIIVKWNVEFVDNCNESLGNLYRHLIRFQDFFGTYEIKDQVSIILND